MTTSSILDNAVASGVLRHGRNFEIAIDLHISGQVFPARIDVRRNGCILVAYHAVTTLFHDEAGIEARANNIAEIAYKPNRKDLEEAVRSGGQSLIELLKSYAVSHDQTFLNGNSERMLATCKVLANFLRREIETTSGVHGITPRMRIRWNQPYEDPGVMTCLSRWFGWRKWVHLHHMNCLLLRPETYAIGPSDQQSEAGPLDIWMAAGGIEDPRARLPADASAHEILAAEELFQTEAIPSAHRIRAEIARASRMSPERLERLAEQLFARHGNLLKHAN